MISFFNAFISGCAGRLLQCVGFSLVLGSRAGPFAVPGLLAVGAALVVNHRL